ncbi:MAG TPA: hypothetical protein VJX23_08560, partial [Candidatus Binataceae bacterium]|nr:hypothetical protein [Candidatus Binataceae bacterium]
EFIEGWYNPHRRHSALDYLSPINYERSHDPSSQPQALRRPLNRGNSTRVQRPGFFRKFVEGDRPAVLDLITLFWAADLFAVWMIENPIFIRNHSGFMEF